MDDLHSRRDAGGDDDSDGVGCDELAAPEAPAPHTEPRPRIDLDLPFTTRALRQAGIDPDCLRRGGYLSTFTGAWVRIEAIDRDTMIRSALALHPDDAFASHLSAAEVLDLPVPEHGFQHVTVRHREDRRFRPGLKSHVTKRKRRVIVVRGIRTTDPIQTFINCAGWLSLVDRVILGDALCRRYRIKAKQLVKACKDSIDYYRNAALEAARLVRDGVDSPMETRLRLLIVFAGLPEPTVNYILRDENGDWRRRFDLCYLLIRLVIEYDGRQHAEDTKQWKGDIKRREELDDEGFRMLIVTAEGIFGDPLDTLTRIRRLLIERGMPDVPPIGDGWRDHFPSRAA